MPPSDPPVAPAIKDQLDQLRRAIDAIDHDMVALLKERQEQVEKVLQLKKTHGLSVYHPAREENLISEKRRIGRAVGLDADYLEDIFRRILRQSRVEQTAQLARRGIRPGATVLVVGGRGAMGRYLVDWFGEAGYRMRCLECDDWPRVESLCRGVDLAILSVPIDGTPEVARRLGPYLPARCVLADVTSVKQAPLAAMLEAHSGPVVGLHPLFGPATTTMDKQVVVATPGRTPEACQWLLDQFADWGAIVLTTRAEDHDDIMSIVQALRHFATFIFGRFLYEKRIRLDEALEFSSPIYRLEFGMVGRLFAQDAGLYSEIIFASPERRALLKEYLDCARSNLEMIASADKATFEKHFRQVAEWFDPFSRQALRESTYLIDKLIERF
ncbi:MAG: bifunctional chorismate mutase/prephenate dehydrogenase [Desulfobacterales bacterium]|nr:bifunctional chorismate mutase/prephenate dehydrogenase [Desulfobacterales bacterium]MDJ0887363.1 bifunctional chorismate mutase/prephenate dehydrogenase [Desulfobacterales bacterium]MDJ0990878.1 bifunctional chorismate mutase/prephenate dehydrogenase [Desulfobacterales bacterium]